MKLSQPPRGDGKFAIVWTDRAEKGMREHSGYLKPTW